jgi:hypothetical protein
MQNEADRKKIFAQAMTELYEDFDDETFIKINEGRGG